MQCIPIRDLKNTAAISEMCKKSAAPIYVTKNGYNDMVIMSAEVYDRIRLVSVYEKLMEAEADIDEGRVMEGSASLRKLREKYGYSVRVTEHAHDDLAQIISYIVDELSMFAFFQSNISCSQSSIE